MALAVYAAAGDIRPFGRAMTTEETETATPLLAEASQKLRDAVPMIDAKIADPATTEVATLRAKIAVANAVRRQIENPEGLTADSYSLDDYREDKRRPSSLNLGKIWIDPADLGGLVPTGRRWGNVNLRPMVP